MGAGSEKAVKKEKRDKKEKREKGEKKKSKDRKAKIEAETGDDAVETTASEDVVMEDAPVAEAAGAAVNGEAEEKKEKKSKDKKKDKKDKKEKKEKKEAETEDSGADGDSTKKRKRTLNDEAELAIDLSAPEPPSKKLLRKLKRAGIDPSTLPNKTPKKAGATLASAGAITVKAPATSSDDAAPASTIVFPTHASQSRSKYGVWIGNLSFHTTETTLRTFFTNGSVPADEITRVNLPINPTTKRNKGFAYVDFTTSTALQSALELSESLLDTRRVLIKDAKDFSSRRTGPTTEPVTAAAAAISKKPPSKILYCGNLDFSITSEQLQSHFSFAGKIQRVRLATFQDSGKCKGFGFIDFDDVDSVKRAMLGLSKEEEAIKDTVEGKEEVELFKRRKKRTMLAGRPITMEFGEDPSVRYKKRFGKKDGEEDGEGAEGSGFGGRANGPRGDKRRRNDAEDGDEIEKSWEQKRERKDTRSADPGAAYSADSRRTGAISEGMAKGKKVTFD